MAEDTRIVDVYMVAAGQFHDEASRPVYYLHRMGGGELLLHPGPPLCRP